MVEIKNVAVEEITKCPCGEFLHHMVLCFFTHPNPEIMIMHQCRHCFREFNRGGFTEKPCQFIYNFLNRTTAIARHYRFLCCHSF
uniref:Glycosyl transferase family 1 protein n=1 Tax=Arundo donax TaxID=35708 RepID=A0A0A8ZY84_ARUDO